MDLFRLLLSLEGKVLRTIAQQREFGPLHIHPSGDVSFTVASTGNLRHVRSVELEAGYALATRLPRGSLTAKRVRDEGASEANPAYVSAIMHAIGAN